MLLAAIAILFHSFRNIILSVISLLRIENIFSVLPFESCQPLRITTFSSYEGARRLFYLKSPFRIGFIFPLRLIILDL